MNQQSASEVHPNRLNLRGRLNIGIELNMPSCGVKTLVAWSAKGDRFLGAFSFSHGG